MNSILRRRVIKGCIILLILSSIFLSTQFRHQSYQFEATHTENVVAQDEEQNEYDKHSESIWNLSPRYEEPKILEWSYNTSRDMQLYIHPNDSTAIIPQALFCSHPLFLLVVVCSATSNFKVRQAVRKTWGSTNSTITQTNPFRVVFLLGYSHNATIQEFVKEEDLEFGDIIQEGFFDTYYNLTIKSVMMLKWTTTYCNSVKYVMKTDDDMFVNIESLIFILQKEATTNLLIGSLISGAVPISDPNNKWYTPKNMFSEKVYPNYLSGTGYVMSYDVAEKLYKTALSTPFFHLEDVFITGITAKLAKIRPKNNNAFSYSKRPMKPCLLKSRSVVTSHHLTTSDLYKIWSDINSPKLKCWS